MVIRLHYFPQKHIYGTKLASLGGMKTKKSENTQQTVSQIVQTIDKDGRDVLGFTVYLGENGFYNVMRCFSADDYDQVHEALTEERRQLLLNNKTTEKK